MASKYPYTIHVYRAPWPVSIHAYLRRHYVVRCIKYVIIIPFRFTILVVDYGRPVDKRHAAKTLNLFY